MKFLCILSKFHQFFSPKKYPLNSSAVAVTPDAELKFSYSVRWVESETPFPLRFRRYLDEHFFEHQIHW